MLDTEAARDDSQAFPKEIERPRQADGRGRHRVWMPVVHDHPHRTDAHGDPERQVGRRVFNGRNRARSSAIRSAGGTPVARDGRTVFVSSSQSRGCCSRSARSRNRRCLKNEPFTQPTRFSTLPFLLRPVRPADLHPESEIERHAGERRIPLSHDAIAAPLQRDGLRPIKYRDQGDAAKAGDVIDERAHQAFDLLIGDQPHFGKYFNREAKKCTISSVPF